MSVWVHHVYDGWIQMSNKRFHRMMRNNCRRRYRSFQREFAMCKTHGGMYGGRCKRGGP